MTDQREASGQEVYEKYDLRPRLSEVMDNSESQTHGNCWRLGYYTYILGRRPKKEGLGLLYGRTWHRMQEARSHGADLETCFAIADEMLPAEVDDKYGRTRDRIKEAFERWVEEFRAANNLIEVVRTEEPADIYCPEDASCFLNGCGLKWGGKMDLLFRSYGRLWILDYKTSTQKDDYFGDKIVLDHQLRGYAWLLSHLMGERVWGVLVDRTVINKSTIQFNRFPHAISDGHLMSFVRNQRQLYRMREALAADGGLYDMNHWPENPDFCFRYGKCAFHGVCSTSPWVDTEARLKLLSSDYVEHRHDFYNLDKVNNGE